MPYHIEVVALEDDLYERLSGVVEWLSDVQPEFQFRLPPERLRGLLIEATRPLRSSDAPLLTENIWTALRDYRATARGDRRYLIAFTRSSLESPKYKNLFGSTEAGEGLAVVTVADQATYTSSFEAYVAYYLTRYTLGFVVPELRNHEDTRSCLFDRKIDKRDLRLSLRSGRLCDSCWPIVRRALDDGIERAVDLLTRTIRDYELGDDITDKLPTNREIDLLITTALTEEAQVVEAVLSVVAKRSHMAGGVTFYDYKLPNGTEVRLATACAHAMGATHMGVFASPLLREHCPRSATLVGIAAAVDGGAVSLGDVPFSSHVFSYDDIAVHDGQLTFRTEGYPVDPAMRRAAGTLRTSRRTYAPWQDDCQRLLPKVISELNELRRDAIRPPQTYDRPHLLVEVTAGGPFLLRDRGFVESLRRPQDELGAATSVRVAQPLHPKLVSAEMESHGFMRSAHEHGIPATVIKGISDNGDAEKQKQEKETGGYYRALAGCNAVLAALHVLHHVARAPRRSPVVD